MTSRTRLPLCAVLFAAAVVLTLASSDDEMYTRITSWQTSRLIYLSTSIHDVMKASLADNLDSEILVNSTEPVNVTITDCENNVLLKTDEPTKNLHVVIPRGFISRLMDNDGLCSYLFLTGSTKVIAESNYTARVRDPEEKDGFLPKYVACKEDGVNESTLYVCTPIEDTPSSLGIYLGFSALCICSLIGALISGPCLVSDGLGDDDEEDEFAGDEIV